MKGGEAPVARETFSPRARPLSWPGPAASAAPGRTVAFFGHGGFLAHVTRLFEIGRAVASRGHRVVFFLEGPYAEIPRRAGFEVRPVHNVDRRVTLRLAARAGACSLSWWRGECERSVESDLECLRVLQPDLVVGDMHWSLCTSARAARVPYVAVTNGAWTRHYAEPIDVPAGHFSAKILGARLARRLFPYLKEVLVRYYALGYTHLRRRYGLPPVQTLYDLIEGDVALLADLPEFMPLRPEAPRDRYRFIGPVLWDADLPEPSWLRELDPSRPTVYFTMGSTGDTVYQILITTGGLADIGTAPKNVFVQKYAPGRALLRRSGVVVSHGGNGTVYQALSEGVPVFGFPSIFDQEINMQRVVALCAGLNLWRSEYDAPRLRQAVERVLGDSSYREHARRLQRRIAAMHGPSLAAAEIESLLAAHPRSVLAHVTADPAI